MQKAQIEDMTKRVYGDTFDRYDKKEFLEFLRPLEVRLEANGVPQSSFAGKRCLDAGCGGGRGTVLMARAGAADVLSYDLSEKNVATTVRNAGLFDLKNVRTQCGSLLDIPFPDESFDVVWCNGVLQHTVDGDRALQEILRVLKVGGHLWLYVYGAGGIYWYMVDFYRGWLKETDLQTAILHLALAGTPTGRIAEFMDDWYVPMLERYTHETLGPRLKELGVADPRLLTGGMSYDTSVRRANTAERAWMGVGDLRYWATKTSRRGAENRFSMRHLDQGGVPFQEPAEVLAFGEDFKALDATVRKAEAAYAPLGPTMRLSVAARLQTWLRDTFTAKAPFDPEAFRGQIRHHIDLLRGSVGA